MNEPGLINVSIDTKQLLLSLDKGQRRLAYASVNAINRTGEQVQKAIHARVTKEFIVRKKSFFFGSSGRAGGVAGKLKYANVNQGRAYAEIWLGGDLLQGTKRLLLPVFEAGGERKPFGPGSKSVAIPLLGRPARPSISAGVPPAFTFAGLQFRAYRKGRKRPLRKATTRSRRATLFGEFGRVREETPELGKVQWKGLERTFILAHSASEPFGGVFQRIGGGRQDIREIYAFRRGLKIDDRLGFYATANATVDANFKENLERETLDALAHAGFAR